MFIYPTARRLSKKYFHTFFHKYLYRFIFFFIFASEKQLVCVLFDGDFNFLTLQIDLYHIIIYPNFPIYEEIS